MEIYALEIQMYTVQKNNKKLKALYEQSLHIKSAIPHPLIMGVIRGMNHFVYRLRTNNWFWYFAFFIGSMLRMRRQNAFAWGRVWKGTYWFLWSIQKLWWKRLSTPYHMPEVFGTGKYVSLFFINKLISIPDTQITHHFIALIKGWWNRISIRSTHKKPNHIKTIPKFWPWRIWSFRIRTTISMNLNRFCVTIVTISWLIRLSKNTLKVRF